MDDIWKARLRDFLQVLIVFLALGSSLRLLFSSSANPPDARTGAVGEMTCLACHTGAALTDPSSDISLSLPASYVPGAAYALTFAISNGGAGNQGFEVTAQRASDNGYAASWSSPGAGSTVGGANWWKHSVAGNGPGWTVIWTAPAANTGNVRFFGIANKGGAAPSGNFHKRSWEIPERAVISVLSPAFGSIAQTVTLSGSAFGAVLSTATLNGLAIPCSSWSNTAIACGIPPGASSGNVSVVNSTAASAGAAFTVITAAPTLGAVTPSLGISGTTASLTLVSGGNFSPGATLRLVKTGQSDILATGVSIPNQTAVSAASLNLTTAAAGFWNLVLTNPDGQSGTLPNAFNVVNDTAALPGKPELAGVVLSSSAIRWEWTAVTPAANQFQVRASTGSLLVALPGSATYWVESGRAPDTAYSRIVRSSSTAGFTNDSGVLTLTTVGAANQVSATAAGGLDHTFPDGTRIQIPAGALEAGATVLVSTAPFTRSLKVAPATLTSANSALPGRLSLISGSERELVVVIGNEAFSGNFNSPVTVSLPYQDLDNDGRVDGHNLLAERLAPYVLNENLARWEPVSSFSLDKTERRISAQLSHFSVPALIGGLAASSLSTLKVYPIPYRPGSGGGFDGPGITFKNLTGQAAIRIFTLKGEKVVTLEKGAFEGDEKTWDTRNHSGKRVASGTYLYVVGNLLGETARGRIVIIK